jgi:cysteine desulfurase
VKLTSKRIYFDYNATSPLAPPVLDWLSKGSFFYGNPSSFHRSGKNAKRVINQAEARIREIYNLNRDQRLFFHSGATEALFQLLQGFRLSLKSSGNSEQICYFSLSTDHSCVKEQKELIEMNGHSFVTIDVDAHGEPDDQKIIELINEHKGPSLLNWTWVNNETGLILDLNRAKKIKEATGCYVHVDGVQSIGKIENWMNLEQSLDSYTFSGHKFGALKGIGFSLFKEDFPYYPLIRGGGQQQNLRSGTQNTQGVESLHMALDYMVENFNPDRARSLRGELHEVLKEALDGKGELLLSDNSHYSLSTACFIHHEKRSDALMTAMDFQGLDVSNGSACASGANLPNRVLLAMGYDELAAKSSIRLSFSPFIHDSDFQSALSIIKKCL